MFYKPMVRNLTRALALTLCVTLLPMASALGKEVFFSNPVTPLEYIPASRPVDTGRDATRSPAFGEGYAELCYNLPTVLYIDCAGQQEWLAKLGGAGTVYVSWRETADAYDRLFITFDTADQGVAQGWVDAACLRPMSGAEAEAFAREAETQPDVSFYEGRPLALLACEWNPLVAPAPLSEETRGAIEREAQSIIGNLVGGLPGEAENAGTPEAPAGQTALEAVDKGAQSILEGMLGDGPLPEAPGGAASLEDADRSAQSILDELLSGAPGGAASPEDIDRGAQSILDELLSGAPAQTSADKDTEALLERILENNEAAAEEPGDDQEESVAGEQPGAEEAPGEAGEVSDEAGEAVEIPGEAEDVSDEAVETSGEAEDVSGEAEEVSGEAEDVSGEAVETSGEAEDVSGEAEEVSTEAGEPGEEAGDMPAVLLTCVIDTEELIVGETVVTLTAAVEGVPEGCEYTLQWQNDLTGTFEDVPGETGERVTFVATEENIRCEWRALLVLPGEDVPAAELPEPPAPEAAPQEVLPEA
ncbi:MAG: hypothetical protein FWF69_00360 [Firmicutes bacterium]|nr:hypothetical protein [Bacillota bacterium]